MNIRNQRFNNVTWMKSHPQCEQAEKITPILRKLDSKRKIFVVTMLSPQNLEDWPLMGKT